MPRYEVLRDCFGFQGKFWKRGECVELGLGLTPPKHFRLVEPESKAPPSEVRPAVVPAVTSEVTGTPRIPERVKPTRMNARK